ncbi:hypothetical protein HFN65_31125 [Rhizobium laguerreae]|uniref:hypothetical protein n=1 Tax=Rhizobium laguerreae TaxID=1076926 RepID=UPI001C91E03D|nr:hypothetical protein [Rhizobium laguerreae]MBY3575391.1 hypothetical protein [Rhizobium laguerreae]
MIDVIVTTSYAVAAISVIVILTGLLSGLIIYGAMEQFFRGPLQKAVISSITAPLTSRDRLIAYLVHDREDREFYRVTRGILNELTSGVNAFPILLGVPESNFFRLPFRQLCGQLISSVSSEAASFREDAGADDRFPGLIEVLSFLALNRPNGLRFISRAPPDYSLKESITDSTRRELEDNWNRLGNLPNEVKLELATSEVDQIQITLASHISRVVFWSAFAFWSVGLIWITASALRGIALVEPQNQGLIFLLRDTWWFGTAVFVALLLALAAAVTATVSYTWLDNSLANR